jgi:hypothetical protein
MPFSSTQKPEKHPDYHLLPDSESALPAETTDLKNGGRIREEASHVLANEAESHKHKLLKGAPVHRKAYLNKYALGGAILASTNSILLGYGKIYSFI